MDNSDAELVTNDWTEPTTATEPVVSGTLPDGTAADSTDVTGPADAIWTLQPYTAAGFR